jgi:simple sugar transport system permease protein
VKNLRLNSRRLWLLKLLDGDRTSPVAIPLFSVVLTLAAASILILILGKNPFQAIAAFLQGSGFLPKQAYAGGQSLLTDLFSFLGIMTPMLLASLAIIAGLKTGLFNIGVSGQMLAAGFLATLLVGYSSLPPWIARPLVILIGIAVGGLLGALVGFLKYKFNIHEVVSTIMFNYIISYVTGFFINSYYVDIITRSSRAIKAAARLTLTGITWGRMRPAIPLGLLIALLAVFILRFLLDRTSLGFELKAVGLNRNAARYAGIKEGKAIIMGMLISGILAGLAGVTYYLGYYNTILPKTLAGMGYDSIAVALLGNLDPVASILASILVTIFQKGSVYLSSSIRVPGEIASVITGILLFFAACGTYIRWFAHSRLERATEPKRSGGEGSPLDPATEPRRGEGSPLERAEQKHEHEKEKK